MDTEVQGMVNRKLERVVDAIYASYHRAAPNLQRHLGDAHTRHPELTRRLLDEIGAPDLNRDIVLVAGSKGKGSTCRMISAILEQAGFKVGLFTSPHLVSFTERIRINGRAISAGEFMRYWRQVQPVMEKIEEGLPPHIYQGPVGITLAVAMLAFREHGTQVDVVECGRGGAYDDTVVLPNRWSVITTIVDEHVEALGPTLVDIAKHKAGIIKEGQTSAFCAPQVAEVRSVLAERAAAVDVPLFQGGQHFQATGTELVAGGTRTRIITARRDYGQVVIPLMGGFQAQNAALAAAVAEGVAPRLGDAAVLRALSTVRWPGRCQVLQQHPTVLVDGAINRVSALYLQEVVTALNLAPVVAVVGITADKDYRGVLAVLGPLCREMWLATASHTQYPYPADAVAVARRYCQAREAPHLADAVDQAVTAAGEDGLVLVVGTQHLVGEAMRLWGYNPADVG